MTPKLQSFCSFDFTNCKVTIMSNTTMGSAFSELNACMDSKSGTLEEEYNDYIYIYYSLGAIST